MYPGEVTGPLIEIRVARGGYDATPFYPAVGVNRQNDYRVPLDTPTGRFWGIIIVGEPLAWIANWRGPGRQIDSQLRMRSSLHFSAASITG